MAASESVAIIRQITAYSQNLREYEGSMQTSGIRGTLYAITYRRIVGGLENFFKEGTKRVCCFQAILLGKGKKPKLGSSHKL